MTPVLLKTRHECSLIDLTNLTMAGFLILLYLLALPGLPHPYLSLALYMFLILLVGSTVLLREHFRGRRFTPLLIFTLTVLFLFIAFESLGLTLSHVNPRRYDWFMVAVDHALLGVHPTLWLEPFIRPWATELLYIFYALYFPLPVILLVWMLQKRRYQRVSDGIFRYLICYYGAYATYFLLPVRGPRFELTALHAVPLKGLYLSEPVRRIIDFLEPNKLDAFPSLHAAILGITVILAFRENRVLFRWFMGCGLGILVSLVYLRYHYVVDVIAGLIWAAVSWYFGGWVAGRFGAVLAPHFGEGSGCLS
jgi:membrane-associated phospholipid phosphatase